jgi:hypothetical protein
MTQATMPPDARAESAGFIATLMERNEAAWDIAMDMQGRFSPMVEMARLIERESDDLCAESEAARIRICAEVIMEAAEVARTEAERIEVAHGYIREALRKEAGNA